MPRGRGGVEYELAGDSREVVNALQKIGAEIEKTNRRFDEMARKGKKGSEDTASGLERAGVAAGRMVRELAVAIGVGGSISAAISAIRAEFQKTIELAEAARQTKVDVAGAFRNLQFNFNPDAQVNREQLAGRIGNIAEATGTNRRDVAVAAGKVFSASELSNEQTLDAVQQAFRLAPGDSEFAAELASGAVDLAAKTGQTDVRPLIGQILQAQGAARVTDLPSLVTSSLPAVAASVATGDTSEQGFELFAALSKLATDKTGKSTSTAQISLATQLRDFVPTDTSKDARGEFTVPGEQIAGFEAAGSTSERIAALQQSPELRRSFLAASSFEKRFQIPIEQILSGDQAAVAALGNAEGKIGGANAAAARKFEDFITTLDAGRFEGAAAVEREQNINQENLELAGGVRAQARSVLERSLSKTNLAGIDAIEKQAALTRFDLLTDEGDEAAISSAEQLIRGQRDALRDGNRLAAGFQKGAPEQIQFLEAQLRVLEEMRDRLPAAGAQQRPVPAAALGN